MNSLTYLTDMVSNEDFLKAIFGEQYVNAHVTSYLHDPTAIPPGEQARCWSGGAYKDVQLIPGSNQFYTVSLFSPDEQGRSRRRKALFSSCYVIGLDDVKEKLPIEQVLKLPAPSIVLKSSRYSEQWLYLLATPEISIDRIDNLHDGLISNGLAPDSKDPGMKSVTRYLRLPEGCNTKVKRIQENGGTAPRCEVTEWHPEKRYTLEQLAVPFGVDLDAPRKQTKADAAAVSDHPLLTAGLNIKEVRSDGRYEVTCPWLDEHTGTDDSGSAVFTNADGSIGFKCHHGSCQHRTGADLLSWIEQKSPGFNDRLKQWQMFRELPAVSSPPVIATQAVDRSTDSALSKLLAATANGDSRNMKKQMLDDKFILKDLAILGQFTVFYASPNLGKTLLTLWLLREAIKSGKLDGSKVMYLNADDTYRGGVEKLEIAEQVGFKMLLPNVKGFKSNALVQTMKAIVDEGDAKGIVVVIDTLKKVLQDVMDKKLSSQFGQIAREFVSAGGSLIALSHTNKHRIEGRPVAGGTSDIPDDADCVYILDKIGTTNEFCSTTSTVEFECIKSRGDVAQKAAFRFTKEKGAGYMALFDSVKRVSKDEAESVQQTSLDTDAIEQIKAAITNGQYTKGDIKKFVVDTSDISHRGVLAVLSKYEGRLWQVEKGLNNASIYSLNEAPEPPVSFL